MNTENNTKWWILGGAAALVSAALVWQAYADENAEANEDKLEDSEIEKMLKEQKLDKVKMDGMMINAQYFLELLQFIITTVKEQDKEGRQKQVNLRRIALKDKDDDEYVRIVREMLMAEEQASNEFLLKVIQLVGIDQQQFEMTHGKLMSNPQTQELVMMAQQGQFKKPQQGAHETPKITKGKTMQYIKRLKETSKEKMMEMTKKQMEMEQKARSGGEMDQMEMMVMMMVEQAKMSDESFAEMGVEQEDFEKSVMYFCAKDPEVKMAMQTYMMEMQMQMQGGQGGGGMGGPGGPPRRR